jgi:hypothetical protein
MTQLLSANQQNLETDHSGFLLFYGTTQSLPHAYAYREVNPFLGGMAMKLGGAPTASPYVLMWVQGPDTTTAHGNDSGLWPVTPGKIYTLTGAVSAGYNSFTRMQFWILNYDINGNYLGQAAVGYSTGFPWEDQTFKGVTRAQAPAAFVELGLVLQDARQALWFDNLSFTEEEYVEPDAIPNSPIGKFQYPVRGGYAGS